MNIKNFILKHISIILLLLLSNFSCEESSNSDTAKTELDKKIESILEDYNIASIAIGVISEKKLVLNKAYGMANIETGKKATKDTIYNIASCSKPVTGLAIAKLLEEDSSFSLDTDIKNYLGNDWSSLKHPFYSSSTITLSQLVTHKSGIASDSPYYYDEGYSLFPNPDPFYSGDKFSSLNDFLQEFLLEGTNNNYENYWLKNIEPGSKEAYSNLGTALAALVVEKKSGIAFNEYSNQKIFNKMNMKDTRWFFNEFTNEQQERVAIPYDTKKEAYKYYGFYDYPSGLLRTTISDFSKLMIMLMNKGMYEDKTILKETTVEKYHDVPIFIIDDEVDGVRKYEHSGGESGVNSYFVYYEDGKGWLYFINSDLEDSDLDKVANILDEQLLLEAEKKN